VARVQTPSWSEGVFLFPAVTLWYNWSGKGGTTVDYRKLGRTGLEVSDLALGSMQFGWTADEETAWMPQA